MDPTMLSRRELLAALVSSGLAASVGAETLSMKDTDMDQNQSPEPPAEYEVIVVGGSFAGLSAAMQLARARRRVLIIDTGKPRNRFAKTSHGFFGQDGRAPKEILETARRQLLAYPTVKFLRAEAIHAVGEKDRFLVRFGDNGEARARRLVLATGVTDHLPEVPGMKELWGTGVAHCPYCHGYEVSGRKLAVFSVGKASVHQAL
ncbi:MAG TPA: NAD(P)/FAD-dependent oxidoreductase, partial [Gemmatimonadales bacterium]|nr:NAD(P)/FAD-dependent oxidoreductase [Gemmatimonadales bacterium]